MKVLTWEFSGGSMWHNTTNWWPLGKVWLFTAEYHGSTKLFPCLRVSKVSVLLPLWVEGKHDKDSNQAKYLVLLHVSKIVKDKNVHSGWNTGNVWDREEELIHLQIWYSSKYMFILVAFIVFEPTCASNVIFKMCKAIESCHWANFPIY